MSERDPDASVEDPEDLDNLDLPPYDEEEVDDLTREEVRRRATAPLPRSLLDFLR